jgi:hypothetical protein
MMNVATESSGSSDTSTPGMPMKSYYNENDEKDSWKTKTVENVPRHQPGAA